MGCDRNESDAYWMQRDELARLRGEAKEWRTFFVQFRQGLRDALYDFWPNNPGVGDEEIINAVRRCVREHERLRAALQALADAVDARLHDPNWMPLLKARKILYDETYARMRKS